MSPPTVREFLGLRQTNTVWLCLPQFEGTVATRDGLIYRGSVHVNRDVNAALHISELAFEAGADISYVAPQAPLARGRSAPATLVYLGSRSNAATNAFMRRARYHNVVWFDYGREWAIHSRSGRRYALPDPSKLDRDAYASSTDYGLVAIYNDSMSTSVVVAGLGSRATEGCGLYLRENWRDLAERTRGSPAFAAILKFAPPIDPGRYEVAEFVAN